MDTNDVLARVARLSDHDLLAQVKDLAQREREATVALIVHLAELDERRLYLAEGHPSLFRYCTDVLHLSEHAAYNRIETARAVWHFPVLLEHLTAGWVTLSAVRRLAPHLTPESAGGACRLRGQRSGSRRCCQVERSATRSRTSSGSGYGGSGECANGECANQEVPGQVTGAALLEMGRVAFRGMTTQRRIAGDRRASGECARQAPERHSQ
ncbi:MAG: hypothetical protein ACT4PY_12675 [Armatimonadota bacterium]